MQWRSNHPKIQLTQTKRIRNKKGTKPDTSKQPILDVRNIRYNTPSFSKNYNSCHIVTARKGWQTINASHGTSKYEKSSSSNIIFIIALFIIFLQLLFMTTTIMTTTTTIYYLKVLLLCSMHVQACVHDHVLKKAEPRATVSHWHLIDLLLIN